MSQVHEKYGFIHVYSRNNVKFSNDFDQKGMTAWAVLDQARGAGGVSG